MFRLAVSVAEGSWSPLEYQLRNCRKNYGKGHSSSPLAVSEDPCFDASHPVLKSSIVCAPPHLSFPPIHGKDSISPCWGQLESQPGGRSPRMPILPELRSCQAGAHLPALGGWQEENLDHQHLEYSKSLPLSGLR